MKEAGLSRNVWLEGDLEVVDDIAWMIISNMYQALFFSAKSIEEHASQMLGKEEGLEDDCRR